MLYNAVSVYVFASALSRLAAGRRMGNELAETNARDKPGALMPDRRHT